MPKTKRQKYGMKETILDQIDTLCWLVHYVFASRINRGEQLSLTELRFFVRLGQDKNCFKWLSSTLKEGVWQQQQREWEMKRDLPCNGCKCSSWELYKSTRGLSPKDLDPLYISVKGEQVEQQVGQTNCLCESGEHQGISQSKTVHLRNIGDEKNPSLDGQVPVVELWVNEDVQSRLPTFSRLVILPRLFLFTIVETPPPPSLS